mmetsp:Transcript_128876/g.358827  ORF Transcript_128876/g.358827 Transcript_128876/m.358827 type:complete len:360 (-) Transcript_128876:175-1254(-)
MAEQHAEDSPTSSTAASESEAPVSGVLADGAATLSGANGKFLAQELAKWINGRPGRQRSCSGRGASPQNAWEQWELSVAALYDRPFGAMFNFIYDVLQFSSGRDKFCALMQGYAKFASAALSEADSERHWMYRGIEDSLSDGRKIFRLFKEFREVYKVRRGLNRFMEGLSESGLTSSPAACGVLDMLGHSASLFYYLFDNILWAASVGIVRSKEVPRMQRKMWHGFRRNGPLLSALGGVASVKRKKNFASIWRLNFAILANVLLLRLAISRGLSTGPFQRFRGLDDARLFHTLELVSMFASYRILLSKLGFLHISHRSSGLLAMLAAACGIWSNWRKVRRKNCGTKKFVTTVARRQTVT